MLGAIFAVAVVFAQAAPQATPQASPDAATAAAPGTPVSPVTVTGKKDPNLTATEMVCHKEAVLGSLFPKEVCATRQAFAQRRNEDQADVRKWTSLRPYHSN
jgi:hypothetical protein